MVKFFSKRRLKIAEQIIIVLFVALLIPMTISGIIINNVNQQSNRNQLRESAIMIANVVSEEIDVFQKSVTNELSQISIVLDNNLVSNPQEYLDKITHDLEYYKLFKVVDKSEISSFENYRQNNDYAIYSKELKNGKYIVAVIDIKTLRENIFRTLAQKQRQIYVISNSDKKLIASINYEEDIFKSSLAQLPKNLEENVSSIYGKVKNQPLVYHKKTNPDVTIIVNTTEDVTKNFIDDNRDKIILSILATMFAIIFVVGLYTSYLYINIRQLFKAIIAISKGNYERRIRLLTNIFTPFEIVFLSNEFNRMVSQIHKSYIQLKKKNKELKHLNEMRSNMIDTVSHEFRTPLTSIQGYTSRLLRQDIEIDEETRQKSLKIIKKQAERLKRMIEDILVIPDIEGIRLNINLAPVKLSSAVKNAILLVKNYSNKAIVNNIEDYAGEIISDNDRIEQVFLNLIENAVKYSKENSEIVIDYELEGNKVVVSIKNDYDVIPKEKLKTLFDKFTRIDDSTTRTTRGTGLGLFIVKGLVEAMNGEIRIYSTEECGFCVKLYLPLFVEEKIYQ